MDSENTHAMTTSKSVVLHL